MARKSNKTAHVLGLITQEKQPNDMPDETDSAEEGAPKPKPARRTVVRKTTPAIMQNSADEHNKLAEDIREKLLEELDGPAPSKIEEPVAEIAPETAAEPETMAQQIADTLSQASPEPKIADTPSQVPSQQQIPVPQGTATNTAPMPAPAPSPITATVADYPLEDFSAPATPAAPSILSVPTPNTPAAAAISQNPYAPSEHAAYLYINVLEELVKERTLEQMQSNGTCTCNRCVMDTMALALTNLPSKYIVVEKGQGIPLLNYYGTRFQIQVLSELTKACIVVRDFPHH